MRTMTMLLLLLWLGGCESTYYAAMEKVGLEKRDILVDRVEEARDAQEDAQEQFTSALERYSALVDFDGGELQDSYDDLNDEYEASEAAAERVYETARRAILRCGAEGYPLPVEKYEQWREIEMTFNPERMRQK